MFKWLKKKTSKQQSIGSIGEEIASLQLKKEGYKVIDRNVRLYTGEIDIIAKDKDTLVFVEVKTRRSRKFGPPHLAVDMQKQKRLSIVAIEYMQKIGYTGSARFDVVLVDLNKIPPDVKIIKNAFEDQRL